tara:strand:+ start:293 stop:1294 length:1002 start_codon:yes stop_codon:yes gene_type:complete
MGMNDKSYKFALGKSLLKLAKEGKTFISLDDLAIPFTDFTLDHIEHSPKQGGNAKPPGKFLNACRDFLEDRVGKEVLLEEAVRNLKIKKSVIQKFHHLAHSRSDVPKTFFEDSRQSQNGLVLKDELFSIINSNQENNLNCELEGRWRLVETSWKLNLSYNLIIPFRYDEENKLLYYLDLDKKRSNITSAREALNGYQKGRCFYCFKLISVLPGNNNTADVDHFLPHHLKFNKAIDYLKRVNIDGVWNLVLSCKSCNRGKNGKFGFIPNIRYLERLNKRNNYLIYSHDPLAKVLMSQTGKTSLKRGKFLNKTWGEAKNLIINEWKASDELPNKF